MKKITCVHNCLQIAALYYFVIIIMYSTRSLFGFYTCCAERIFFFVEIRSNSLKVLYEMQYKMSSVSSKPITVVGYHRRAAAIDLKKKRNP